MSSFQKKMAPPADELTLQGKPIKSNMIISTPEPKFQQITEKLKRELFAAKLTSVEWRLWFYLFTIENPSGHDPLLAMKECKIGASSYFVAIAKFRRLGWFDLKEASRSNSIEQEVRDRLSVLLGGQVEVSTAVGRIDLLTDSEIIEVKNLSNWKAALGQILAYGAFFPDHCKRIHLFGKPNVLTLASAQAICAEFGIETSFEEVQ